MTLTSRQTMLLANLRRITAHVTTQGARRYRLVNEDCTATINSLIVKGVLVKNPARNCLVLATGSQDPDADPATCPQNSR
jgi:hypothetical protein